MKTLVLGAGRSGLAATRFLLAEGRSVLLSDSRSRQDLESSKLWSSFEELESQHGERLEWALGGHPPELLDACQEVVISPGISLHVAFLKEALKRKKKVLGEIELASVACSKPIVAVTGTNGKSTTCSLLGNIFGENGVVGGNIGVALLEQLKDLSPKVDWVVAEISSFQLETVHEFRPRIAILTNLSPDHLDHHKDLEEYRVAKSRMFAQMGPGDTAIFCADDPVAVQIMGELRDGCLPAWLEGFPKPKNVDPPQILTYSTKGAVSNGVGVIREGGQVWAARFVDGVGEKLFPWGFPGLPGEAMMSNGLAAIAASLEAGQDLEEIQSGLRRFHPLRYRMELAGQVDGIKFVNDSKATNIDSALASVRAVDGPLAVIVGGKDKGVDYDSLAKGLVERNGRVFLIGEASAPIRAALEELSFENFEESETMGNALQAGRRFLAASGGTVLLAPACSSFDQFKSAEQRGEIFNQMVQELKEEVNR